MGRSCQTTDGNSDGNAGCSILLLDTWVILIELTLGALIPVRVT